MGDPVYGSGFDGFKNGTSPFFGGPVYEEMNSNEAEYTLATTPVGTFLVRSSTTVVSCPFTVSVVVPASFGGVRTTHFRIQRNPKGLFGINPPMIHANVNDVLSYYTQQLTLTVDNGGKIDPVKFNVPVHIVLPFPPGFFDVLSAQEGMLRARVAPQPTAAVGQKLITNVSASLSDIQVDRNNVVIAKELGHGAFGKVYLATLRGTDGRADMECAAKMLKDGAKPEDYVLFREEVEIMLHLQHPSLMGLVGAVTVDEPWIVCFEMVQYGDLLGVVRKYQEKILPSKGPISVAEMLHIAIQVSDGLNFVQFKGYVHMDVAARNVLVGQRLQCKIADFGLTQRTDPKTKVLKLDKRLNLAVRWQSKETLMGKGAIFSEYSDSYAFGVLCWEMASYGGFPFSEHGDKWEAAIRGGAVLRMPAGCDSNFFNIFAACWNPDPPKRPRFHMLMASFKNLAGFCNPNRVPLRDIGMMCQPDKAESYALARKTSLTKLTSTAVSSRPPPPTLEQRQAMALKAMESAAQ